VIDLTGVSIWNTCGMIFCAIPFMFIFQFFAIIDVIVDSLRTCCAARRDRHEKWVQGRKDRAEARAARKSTCCGRVCRSEPFLSSPLVLSLVVLTPLPW
jgi:hypothetical protein